MKPVIHEYVWERKNKVGVIAATAVGNKIHIGWAKTNLKAGDVFDKNEGLAIALDRANGVLETPSLPPQMVKQMRKFQERALRYFKQATIALVEKKSTPVQNKQPYILDIFDEIFGKKGVITKPEMRDIFSQVYDG